jgi:hypothetical protein
MLFNKNRTMWTDGTYDYWILDGRTYKVPCEKPSADFITPAQVYIIKVTNALKGVALICTTIFIVLIVALLLSACGATSSPQNILPTQQIVEVVSSSTTVPTQTQIPTATIDTQATIDAARAEAQAAQQAAQQAQEVARQAMLTSDAAARLLVDATMTHEAIQLSYSQMTQQADQIKFQQDGMTQAAAQMTATAYSTAFPMTATQQSQHNAIIAGQMTGTHEAPEILQRIAAAENEKKYGWVNYFAIGLMSILGVVLFVWIAMYLNHRELQQKDTSAQIMDLNKKDNIPMAAPNPTIPQQTLRAEFLCTNDQLVLLAKGWIDEKKTAAYNQCAA